VLPAETETETTPKLSFLSVSAPIPKPETKFRRFLNLITNTDGMLQLFQQELSSRQAVVDAIRGSVDNSNSEVRSQIETLNTTWHDVNRLSELRDSRLHEALVLVSIEEVYISK